MQVDMESQPGREPERQRRLMGLLAAGGLTYLGAFHNVDVNVSDEGMLIDSARRVLDGQLVGRDFADLWSGLPLLYASLFSLFGVNVLALRGLMVLVKVAAAAVLFRVGCRLMPAEWALAPAFLTILMSGPFHKAPLLALYLVLLLQACLLLEQPGKLRATLTGVWLGLATFLRFDVAASIVFCLIPWYWKLRSIDVRLPWPRVFGVAALGLLAGLGLTLAVATPSDWSAWPRAEQLRGPSLWDEVLWARLVREPDRPWWHLPLLMYHDLTGVLGAGTDALHVHLAKLMGPAALAAGFPWFLPLVAGGVLLLLGLAGLLACLRFLDGHETLVVCLGLAAMLKFLARPDLPHLAQAVPLLSLLVVASGYRLFTGQWGGARLRPLARIPMLLGLGMIVRLTITAATDPNYYVGGIGILRRRDVQLRYPGVHLWVMRKDADELGEMVRFLQPRLEPGQSVIVLPHSPLLYLMLGVKAPGAYSALYLRHAWFPEIQLLEERQAIRWMLAGGFAYLVEDLAPQGQAEPFPRLMPVMYAGIEKYSKPVFRNSRFIVRKVSIDSRSPSPVPLPPPGG
jgi:hypothetical protein